MFPINAVTEIGTKIIVSMIASTRVLDEEAVELMSVLGLVTNEIDCLMSFLLHCSSFLLDE